MLMEMSGLDNGLVIATKRCNFIANLFLLIHSTINLSEILPLSKLGFIVWVLPLHNYIQIPFSCLIFIHGLLDVSFISNISYVLG